MSRGKKQITREQILTATRELFIEKGYENVALRDIASRLGISLGNLQYYYRTKIQLIETAVAYKHENTPRWNVVSTLGALDLLFRQANEAQKKEMHIFRIYSRFVEESETVREIHRDVIENTSKALKETLTNLAENGLLKEEELPGQFDTLTDTVLYITTYWFENEKNRQLLGQQISDYRQTVWHLIWPLLTEKGKESFKAEVFTDPPQ